MKIEVRPQFSKKVLVQLMLRCLLFISCLVVGSLAIAEVTTPTRTPRTARQILSNADGELLIERPNIPTSDPHYADALECINNLRAKMAELIEQGNLEENGSLQQVMQHQADLAMLRVSRSFLRLRRNFERMSTDLDDEQKLAFAERTLRSKHRRATTNVGRLSSVTMTDQEVRQTLYTFYEYIQNGPGTVGTTPPFQDQESRRKLLKSLQLYSWAQEEGSSEYQYEITDRDIFIIEGLFNNYRPSNQSQLGATFFDTVMNKMHEQFSGQTEVVNSDFNEVDRQIRHRYQNHLNNPGDNYVTARDRFLTRMREEMLKYIKKQPPYDQVQHKCDHFFDSNGRLKTQYRNSFCQTGLALNQILNPSNVNNFEDIIKFLNPYGTPLNLSPSEYNPGMHGKRMYHNLMGCKIRRARDGSGDWEVCLNLYLEHLHGTSETETNWFVNTGRELTTSQTAFGKSRNLCNRQGVTFGQQTSRSLDYINGDYCIDRPLHFTGNHRHDQNFTCEDPPARNSTQLWVRLGDTFRDRVTITGTQEPRGTPGKGIRQGTNGRTPDWERNDPLQDVPDIMTRDLMLYNSNPDPSRDGESPFQCDGWQEYQQTAQSSDPNSTRLDGLIAFQKRQKDAWMEVKAKAYTSPLPSPNVDPETLPARRGTYRWDCKLPDNRESFRPFLRNTATDEVSQDHGGHPCDNRRTSDNQQVVTSFENVSSITRYPRLRSDYKVKVRYLSTVQAPVMVPNSQGGGSSELTAEITIPAFRTVGIRLIKGRLVNGQQEVSMRTIIEDIDGNEVAVSGDEAIRLAEQLITSGTLSFTNECNTERLTAETCGQLQAINLQTSVRQLRSPEGIVLRFPIVDQEYPIRVQWANPDYTDSPRPSNEVIINSSPFTITMNQQEASEQITCTPTLDGPPEQLPTVAATMVWVCQGEVLPDDCKQAPAGPNPRATNREGKIFRKLTRAYTAQVRYTDPSGAERWSPVCNIGQPTNTRVQLSFTPVRPFPNSFFEEKVKINVGKQVDTLPVFAARADGKTVHCPNAPDGAFCKASPVAYTDNQEFTLPRNPIGGQGYDIIATYIYNETSLGRETVPFTVLPMSLDMNLVRVSSDDDKVTLKTTATPVPTGFQSFTYVCTSITPEGGTYPPNPPCGSTVTIDSNIDFPKLDAHDYTVESRLVFSDTVTITRTQFIARKGINYSIQVAKTSENPTAVFYRATLGTNQRVPTGGSFTWECRGEHAPANCGKPVTQGEQPQDEFRRPNPSQEYQVRAVLKSSTGQDLAQSDWHPVGGYSYSITVTKVDETTELVNYRATLGTGQVVPEGGTFMWECRGTDAPANCSKNVTVAADAKDPFTRPAVGKKYEIRAILKNAQNVELAASTWYEINRPEVREDWALEIQDDRKEAKDSEAEIPSLPKKDGTAYRLRSNDKVRWEWKDANNRDKTAEGQILRTTRASKKLTGTAKLIIDGVEKATATFEIAAKESCKEKDDDGNCITVDPVIPPLPDLEPSPAPPSFSPTILPPRPGMYILPGFR